jgi:hypothetical protein
MATYDSKMYPVNPPFILDACLDRSSVDVSRHASSGSIQMSIQDKMRIQWIHFRVVSSHPFGYSFGSIQRNKYLYFHEKYKYNSVDHLQMLMAATVSIHAQWLVAQNMKKFLFPMPLHLLMYTRIFKHVPLTGSFPYAQCRSRVLCKRNTSN